MTAPSRNRREWYVSTNSRSTIYENDKVRGMMTTPELAQEVCRLYNAELERIDKLASSDIADSGLGAAPIPRVHIDLREAHQLEREAEMWRTQSEVDRGGRR